MERADTVLIILCLFILLVIFAAGAFLGKLYHPKTYFEAGVRARYVRSFYIPPNAFYKTIRLDRYLDMEDNVLRDVALMDTSDHPYGAWVVVASDEPIGSFSTYTNASGDYYYYDAMTGELIEKRVH